MPQRQPGTFADLYDVEQSKKTPRRGRPKRKEPRKQVTLYFTPEQEELLSELHYQFNKRFKVERSDLAGLAIEILADMVTRDDRLLEFRNFKSLKVWICDTYDLALSRDSDD